MIPHNKIRLILLVTSKRNLLKLSPLGFSNLSNKPRNFCNCNIKNNLLSNQDIYLIKHRFILIEENFYYQTLKSGLNPPGVWTLDRFIFFSKRKIAL